MQFRLVSTVMFASVLAIRSMSADEPTKTSPPKAPTISTQDVERLIEQLGDGNFQKREKARAQLEAAGEAAIVPLKKAIANTENLDLRNAGRAIIEAYEAKHSPLLHTFRGHQARVNGVALSPDGKRAVSVSWDGVVRYWDVEKKTLIKQFAGKDGRYNSIALHPDGRQALCGGSGFIQVWDLESGNEVRRIPAHKTDVWDIVVSADGKNAIYGSTDGFVRLREIETGRILVEMEAQKDGWAWTAAFAGDGKLAVTGAGNASLKGNDASGSLRLFDLATGKELRRFEGHAKDVRNVAVSPDGKQLLSGSFDGTMRLWDITTGKEIRRFDGPGHFVEAVKFTPDGKRAVSSYGPKVLEAVYDEDPRCIIRMWEVETGKELRQFKGHDGPVLCLALSRDGRYLASGSLDGSMMIWDLNKKD